MSWAYEGFAKRLSRASLRQRVAFRLDRLFKRACWPNLWEWGDRGRPLRGALRADPRCRQDAARTGACWCGKNRATPDEAGSTTAVPASGRRST